MNAELTPMRSIQSHAAHELPLLSVIIPCRNEEHFIAQCLDSILQNCYPPDRLEILVVDGMSEDTTQTVVCNYTVKYPFVKLLRNPKRTAPAALNLGIASSKGEIICRMDAHASIAADYLRRCVELLLAGTADNVGGAMHTLPSNSSLVARAIALCMSHRFGAGNSAFRTGSSTAIYTDTVFGGCYRKETFARIGMFNERLIRTQDMEFNQRLRRFGGKILLDPAIQCDYYASSALPSFLMHNFKDGVWSILPFAYNEGIPVRARHLIPLVFVASVIVLAILASSSRTDRFLLFAELALYAVASTAFSLQIGWKLQNLSFLFLMPLVFGIRHFAYGLGSTCGIFALLAKPSFFRSVFRLVGFGKSVPAPTS